MSVVQLAIKLRQVDPGPHTVVHSLPQKLECQGILVLVGYSGQLEQPKINGLWLGSLKFLLSDWVFGSFRLSHLILEKGTTADYLGVLELSFQVPVTISHETAASLIFRQLIAAPKN